MWPSNHRIHAYVEALFTPPTAAWVCPYCGLYITSRDRVDFIDHAIDQHRVQWLADVATRSPR